MNSYNITDEHVEMMNDLFIKFFGLFPSCFALFKSQEDVGVAKRAWVKAFFDAGIMGVTKEETICFFRKGILATQYLNQPFMPSCGQFIALCKEGSSS